MHLFEAQPRFIMALVKTFETDRTTATSAWHARPVKLRQVAQSHDISERATPWPCFGIGVTALIEMRAHFDDDQDE